MYATKLPCALDSLTFDLPAHRHSDLGCLPFLALIDERAQDVVRADERLLRWRGLEGSAEAGAGLVGRGTWVVSGGSW